ncbi:MAG: C4-dicarboxylate ABC transporter substrate-binding protein, partial [Hyphomicrobiales bacterium]|nr:C4-dicarboxylate ABC transporter substrate-binding protein [Hyphomicrobiales bacterium]
MTTRRTRREVLKTAGAAAFAATAIGAPSILRAQTLNFKLHHFLGPKAPAHTAMLEPWARAV